MLDEVTNVGLLPKQQWKVVPLGPRANGKGHCVNKIRETWSQWKKVGYLDPFLQ